MRSSHTDSDASAVYAETSRTGEEAVVRPAAASSEQGQPVSRGAMPNLELPLEGARVRIRALERRDLDRRQAWPPFNDPLYLVWDMPRCGTRQNDRWFSQLTDGRRRLAYAVENRAGHLIGMLSLRQISWGRTARLGIAFSLPYTDQGYGTETLCLFLPFFFVTLDFRKMVLDVAAANLRAVHCYDKVGFRRVRTYWRPVDGPLDLSVLERPEYASVQAMFRWRWGRVEALNYDMELAREDWAGL
jgi:RimJ/RimL family protein N-acetyltransferase